MVTKHAIKHPSGQSLYTGNPFKLRKKVPTIKIISALECSEPTLTRVLKEIRDSYGAEIKYSKASRAYQMTERGQLDSKALRRMREALSASEELRHNGMTSKVYLDKDKKKSVSLSLKMSALRKIDRLSYLNNSTRSEAVELLVDHYIENLIQSTLAEMAEKEKEKRIKSK